MTPWKLTLGLATGAIGAIALAPRLVPWLASTPPVEPLPVAQPVVPPPVAPAATPPAAVGSVTATARLDHGAVQRGVPAERYLVIEVAGPAEAGAARGGVDLAVVLDASGSMSQAGKIDYARRGAAFLVSELSPDDGFSLVTFSDRAHVLLPLSPVGDRTRAERAIDRVVEGGGTNIGDGLEAAEREIARADGDGVRRIVLLSDGRANIGQTDPGALSRMAAGLAARGVTVSTIGLGLDYNEDLLARMSDLGGGSYDFVDTPGELHAALQDELARSSAQVARSATVDVALPPGVSLLEVVGWPATVNGNDFSVFMGDVYAGGKRKIVARVRVTGTGDLAPVADVTVRYDDLQLGTPATAVAAASTAVTADPAVVARSADAQVGALASRAAGNWYAEQSVRARKEGRGDAAEQLVRQARGVLAAASKRYQSPEIEADLQAMEDHNAVLEVAPPASPEAERASKQVQEAARGLYK